MRSLLGLRGRLLLALVLTSAVTLTVAAYALVGPLTDRLRSQSIRSLRTATISAQDDIQRARRRDYTALQDAGLALQYQANARVVVGGQVLTDFAYDTDIGAPTRDVLRVALRTLRTRQTVTDVEDDKVTIGVLLRRPDGVLVSERRLTDVGNAVEQVRTALAAAALVGLLVAIALSVGLSTTLLRRLARLRTAALRISAEGPAAPPPQDEVRDEIGDLARAFARMQEALRREEASRRSFVATASHELRTPLTMLQGTMELLEEDLADGRVDISDAQQQVASARRELLRLSSLAGELLDLSRLDAQVPLRSEPVEVGEMARAVAAEFSLRARERAVSVDVAMPAGPRWVCGDPDAVARIVRILVDNALRHAPAGSTVWVDAEPAAPGAAIEVVDRGRGVLPQDRDRIFERFYRSADAGAESGFGLGLAIGRGLARQMGGDLRLASGDGVGARFVLELPPAEV
ncbi:MAG TPA: HAMP domain-containing sensor histidine kinase, partial [Solirubrobacteraceae bacterium]